MKSRKRTRGWHRGLVVLTIQEVAFHELEGNLPGEMTLGRAVISMPGTRQEQDASRKLACLCNL